MSTQKRTRCKKGTRKNKKTGNCESVMDNTCAVCLERIISGNIKTKCKHNFHKKCLIGWCKSKSALSVQNCPICRGNINDTCKKIIPFCSEEAFRYVWGSTARNDKLRIEQLSEIIYHPKFDINVSNGKHSILHELCYNRYKSLLFKDLIDYLLSKPNIIIYDDLILLLNTQNNSDILQLFKKHKKIPKHLKCLI